MCCAQCWTGACVQHTLWEQGCSRAVREPRAALVHGHGREVPVVGASLRSAWEEDAHLGAESLPSSTCAWRSPAFHGRSWVFLEKPRVCAGL